MDEKTLRDLVREEVVRALDEELTIDSHPKFRRLVEAKLGRKFQGSDDHWIVTYAAWSDALSEAGSPRELAGASDVLEYYVNDAAEEIKRNASRPNGYDYVYLDYPTLEHCVKVKYGLNIADLRKREKQT